MKSFVFILLSAIFLLGCGNQDSPKVQQQKEIYFSVSGGVPRQELEKEITRIIDRQHLATPGQAMIYSLDQTIAFLPQVNSIVEKAASKTGVQLPPEDALDVAEDQIKLAREIRAMTQAREAIAALEAEAR
jgi:PBP1b-binding outer membrane lipoprotein LpoB